MKVFYYNPNDIRCYKWHDSKGIHNIWCLKATTIYNYKDMKLPVELISFLDKWTNKICKYKNEYIKKTSNNFFKIEFIYKGTLYSIIPSTFSLDIKNQINLKTYQKEIREDLKNDLDIRHSRFLELNK